MGSRHGSRSWRIVACLPGACPGSQGSWRPPWPASSRPAREMWTAPLRGYLAKQQALRRRALHFRLRALFFDDL
eukprot:11222453-Alexandrium_andersonii.AAC.1